MQRLKATDVAYVDLERPSTPAIMAALMVLDPATAPGSFVRHRDVLAYVERRLHLAPNLRRRMVPNPLGIDEPRMIDDANFDLEFHIRHLALPKPRDRRQLNILVARLLSRPIDVNKPLWEMYVIEGLEAFADYPQDAFAILFKLHHAAFDGAAGLSAIMAILQDEPDDEPQPPEQPWRPEPTPTIAAWAANTIQESASQMFANFQAAPNLLKGAYKGIGSIRESTFAVPKTRFQGPITTHRVVDWVNLDMARVLALRARLGKPKVNDIALTIIGGALRAYLGGKGELPADSLVALCPINVRGDGDPKDGGNQISAMRVQVRSDIADPIERLAAIGLASGQGKAQAENLGPTFIDDLLALYPYYFRSRLTKQMAALSERVDNPGTIANFVVSNIPPPAGTFYFAGSRALEFTGFGPLTAGIGLFHTISGMQGVMSIAVNSDREMLRDIHVYMDCLRASFEQLEAKAPLK